MTVFRLFVEIIFNKYGGFGIKFVDTFMKFVYIL